MDELYDLKDKLCRELKKYSDRDLSGSGIEIIDKLTHTIKNLDKILESGEYSGAMPDRVSNRNNSMAYDRYSNARRRDSRGRYTSRDYSRDGYSYHEGTVEELREIMEEAPESVKSDIQRVIRKMESM